MHRALPSLAVALVAVLFPSWSHAAEQKWLRAVSANFELYTTERENVARDAILYFERVRAFFISATSTKAPPQKVIRIIGFSSEKEYRPYSPKEGARAYYQSGPRGDWIVMPSLDSDLYPVAVHEYTHSMLRNQEVKLPLWLNEGIAEVYSTFKVYGDWTRVGEVSAERLRYLLRGKWLDLPTLVTAGRESRIFDDRELMSMFYAEGWALTHMLMLSDNYRSKFTSLFDAIAKGEETAAAIDKVYGRSLGQLERDLQAYVQGGSFNAVRFSFALEKNVERPDIRPATPLESALALAGLLADNGERQEEGRQAYAKLAAEYPKSWRPEAGLAYLALDKDRDEARRHFARAEEMGSDDAKMYFDYAMMGAADAEQKRIALLQKAVNLNPDFKEANYYLGFALYGLGDYRGAHDALMRVKQVTPEQALQFFLTLASCDDHLGLPDMAKENAKRALDCARTPADSEAARRLLEYVSRPKGGEGTAQPAPALPQPSGEELPRTVMRLHLPQELYRAEGVLLQVDCLGEAARLWIMSGGEKLAFVIADPKGVIVEQEGKQTEHEFRCGVQQPQKVLIQYEKKPDAGLMAQGVIRALEFQ